MDIARELVRIAVLVSEMPTIGRFSRPSSDGIYFHGFGRAEYLLAAILKGSFGKQGLTSIGASHSKVPHYDRIWFRPTRVKLYPVLYGKGDDALKHEEAVRLTGLSGIEAQIGPAMFEKEQEWYAPGPVRLADIDVVMVSIVHGTKPELASEIRSACEEHGYPFSPSHWER